MKWPYMVRHQKNGPILVRIYKPKSPHKESPNPYSSYRVMWMAFGKRMARGFHRFGGEGGAKRFAEKLVRDLVNGSSVAALTPGEARSAGHSRCS